MNAEEFQNKASHIGQCLINQPSLLSLISLTKDYGGLRPIETSRHNNLSVQCSSVQCSSDMSPSTMMNGATLRFLALRPLFSTAGDTKRRKKIIQKMQLLKSKLAENHPLVILK